MKPIIVIDLPLGMGIDREITEPYGYDLFYGDENIEAQWKKLEKLRETRRTSKNWWRYCCSTKSY